MQLKEPNTTLWTLFLQLSRAGLGAQLIGLAVYPIISRLFEPSDFGVRATFSALLMLLLPFATLNLEFAVPLAQSRKEAAALFNTSLWITLMLSGAALLMTGLVWLTPLAGHPVGPFLWLLAPGLLLSGGRKAFLGWATRLAHRRSLTLSRYWMAGIKAGMELTGGWMKASLWLLVSAQLWGVSAVLFFLFRQMKEEMVALFASFRSVNWRRTLVQFKGYPLYTLPSTFADLLNTHFPLLFFGAVLSMEFTGQFSIGVLLVYLVQSSLGDAFAQAYLVALGKRKEVDKEGFVLFFLRSLALISLVGLSIGLGMALLGGPVLLWVLGSEWAAAAALVPALSWLAPAYFWNALCFHTLNRINRQQIILWVHLMRAIFLFAFFVWLYHMEYSAEWLVIAYVGNTVLFSLVYLGWTYGGMRLGAWG